MSIIAKRLNCQEKKNRDISKIERKLEKLENIMLDESGKGRYHDGRTAKALRASRRYEQLQDRISFIQFKRVC